MQLKKFMLLSFGSNFVQFRFRHEHIGKKWCRIQWNYLETSIKSLKILRKIFSYEKYVKLTFLGHVTLKRNRVACLSSPIRRAECTLEKSTATNLFFLVPRRAFEGILFFLFLYFYSFFSINGEKRSEKTLEVILRSAVQYSENYKCYCMCDTSSFRKKICCHGTWQNAREIKCVTYVVKHATERKRNALC